MDSGSTDMLSAPPPLLSPSLFQFCTYEAVKAKVKSLKAKHKPPTELGSPAPSPSPSLLSLAPASSLAGAAAGLSSSLLLYPLSAVGDHMALQVSMGKD